MVKIKQIKQAIKNKHDCNGNKNSRNNYRINVTNQYRQVIANRKFKLSVRDSLKDITITQELRDIIINKMIAKGFKKSDITKIGILKALEIVK